MSEEEDYGAAVAEDYRHALEDLNMNSRVEIATLTNIAKESITYAHQIAEVIWDHIAKVGAMSDCPGGDKLCGVFRSQYAAPGQPL
jgi:hypothetical protein